MLSHEKELSEIKTAPDFVSAVFPVRTLMVCEEVVPACHGDTDLHQEVPVHPKLPSDHPGLCQCHDASVCSDGYEGAVLPSQRHLQPPHHGEPVPRGSTATQASHQTQRLPQLHHHLQRGIRLDTCTLVLVQHEIAHYFLTN